MRKFLQTVATQPKTFRIAVPTYSDDGTLLTAVVFDDPELIEDPHYAEGVNEELHRAWEEGDYFVVELQDHEGTVIDAVASMAGYGSPRGAALAAMEDYFRTKPIDPNVRKHSRRR
jgi:hypothetical protein